MLPRNVTRKRGLCCRPVSVCPSVTLVLCIQTAEDIVKLIFRPGSPIILVFRIRPTASAPNSPSTGAQNTLGWQNFAISSEIAVYLGNGRDRPIAMER